MSQKKSETLEIRLSHDAKTAFMERCRAKGLTASQALRAHIEAQPRKDRRAPAVIAALVGLAIGAAAAPSLAAAAGKVSSDRAAFARMDANGNGVVSFDEFRAR